jgi:hypothetical protein
MLQLRHLIISCGILCSIILGQLSAAPEKIDFVKQEIGVPQNIIAIEKFDDRQILILDNETALEIRQPPDLEWRSFWEWMTWRKHQQPSDQFFFDFSLWSAPIPTQLYDYQYDAAMAEKIFGSYVGNLATYYPNLIFNIRTNEYLFCRVLKPSEFVEIVQAHAKKQYDIGYQEGFRESKSKGYDQGYSKGYKAGRYS